MALPLLFSAVFILVGCYVWFATRPRKNFPPGPTGLPFIGSILSLGKKPHLTMLQWKEKYGDTYCFFNGRRPVVVLNNYNTVRKVFGEDIASGRFTEACVRHPRSELPLGYGLITSEGQLWKTHRRFALSTLRDLGMGKNWLEDTIITEVEEFCQTLRDTNEKPVDPKVALTNSVSNIICALIFGKRFSLSDPKFSKLTSLLSHHLSIIKYEFILETLPFLMWFPNFIRTKIMEARDNLRELAEFLQGRVDEHNNSRPHDQAVPDFLYAYQKERDNSLKTNEKETFSDKQLLVSLADLFGAGTETNSTTILWTFVYLVENPDIMAKVQNEIDTKTGRDRIVTNADRAQLPYTEAVILEIQRCASLAPLGVPHKSHEEMTIDGFTIPKNTLLAANLYSIHRDPRWWTNPTKFFPEHFFNDTNNIIRPEAFVPFSIGKRACPGEALAKMELFLFIANILRCFILKVPAGEIISHHNTEVSITVAPSPYRIIFQSRL